MPRLTPKTTVAKLRRDNGVLCLTHGHGFTIEPHGLPVGIETGRKLTAQGDLFAASPSELIPNEDGLFPGFSQTWSPVS